MSNKTFSPPVSEMLLCCHIFADPQITLLSSSWRRHCNPSFTMVLSYWQYVLGWCRTVALTYCRANVQCYCWLLIFLCWLLLHVNFLCLNWCLQFLESAQWRKKLYHCETKKKSWSLLCFINSTHQRMTCATLGWFSILQWSCIWFW